MIGYPVACLALLQGLLTALALLAWPLWLAFGGRLRIGVSDVLLALATLPVFAMLTLVVFLPFEGDWADLAFGPFSAFHALLVGGVAVVPRDDRDAVARPVAARGHGRGDAPRGGVRGGIGVGGCLGSRRLGPATAWGIE